MKRLIISFFLIVIIFLGFILLYNKNKIKENSIYFDYFDGVNIKIYTNKNTDSIFENIEEILKKYENVENDDELLKYGYEVKNKTNGFVDINKGSFIKQFEEFKKNKEIPYYIDNNEISYKNIIKSYVINIIKNYLEENNIDSYIINMRNTVLLGNSKGNKFTFALEEPFSDNYLIFLKLNNLAISTVGPYQNYYKVDDKIYHDMIDPIKKKQCDNYKSLTVISDSILESEYLSHYLYYLSIEDGKEVLKKYDADCIWYTNENELVYTKNIESWK